MSAAFSLDNFRTAKVLLVDDEPAFRLLAERFARKGIDRFEGTPWRPGLTGAPVIEGAVAVFECFNRSRYEEGDHVIFVGEVERCQHRAGASPLLFHGGQFYTEHPL